MSRASDIVAALDELIYAKVSGATDLSQLANRMIGQLKIDAATSFEKLSELREKWNVIAVREDGGGWVESRYTG